MGIMISLGRAVSDMGGDRLALLKECLAGAWDTYERVVRAELPYCSPIGMANVLHELVVQEARRRFHHEPGVEIQENVLGGRFLLIIDRRVILQFRKLTKDFHTSNNPTKTSKAFDSQQRIKGLPHLPRLTVGYQLGQYRTSLAGMYLTFLVGKECIWHVDFENAEASTSIEFPQVEGESPAEQEARKDTKRKRLDDAENEDDTGTGGA